jgi:hypothetical protein
MWFLDLFCLQKCQPDSPVSVGEYYSDAWVFSIATYSGEVEL